jgi:hypothetical protein
MQNIDKIWFIGWEMIWLRVKYINRIYKIDKEKIESYDNNIVELNNIDCNYICLYFILYFIFSYEFIIF